MTAAPPDQHARDTIQRVLDRNFLVEAGAGSGKTTSLVARMVALVRSGVRVDEIAAVTFTRKAAAELRQRFQEDLEVALRGTGADDPERTLLDRGIRDLERGFIGTIHAFCARLLRERPLEAGLDPAFQELMEADHERLQGAFWRSELDRMAASDHPQLHELLAVGLRPNELEGAFRDMVDNLDVPFPVGDERAPDPDQVNAVRRALESLLDRALARMPENKPAKGWDDLQKWVRNLEYSRTHLEWDDPLVLLGELAPKVGSSVGVTQNRWATNTIDKHAARDLGIEFQDFLASVAVGEISDRWMAHRYGPALRFVRGIAERFSAERLRTGLLSFQDLLSVAARLLRTRPQARRDLGRRYPHLLIDEFQDTDPIQAEIAFLLASDPVPEDDREAADWRSATPRPGSLFVVGDPKQSIYRFRRADIDVYNAVRELIRRGGEVLTLHANFRSLLPIAQLVNEVFEEAFPPGDNPYQATFQKLMPQRSADGASTVGVFHYVLPKDYWQWGHDHAQAEAVALAGWIARRIERGERSAGDFLILTERKKHLTHYARALEAAGLPVDVSGASLEVERGLEELLTVLQALVDPGNPVLTSAALTGLFFGIDHDQLVEHRLGGGGFDCRRAGAEPGVVPEALRRLDGWWQRSRHLPSDVFVGGLVREIGLLQDAAAGELGRLRTGVLLYALDRVRTTAAAGDTSLTGAVEALSTAVEWGDAETPMEPGRTGAVRVMNVHKAKGLEAPVVVLAAPGGASSQDPTLHVRRGADGASEAALLVGKGKSYALQHLARPLGWSQQADEETKYQDAERDRLRYVAATRAGEELVIAIREDSAKSSPWALFEPWLLQHSRALEDFGAEVSRSDAPLTDGAGLVARVGDIDAARQSRAMPSYTVETVTQRAKSLERLDSETLASSNPPGAPPDTPPGAPRGYEWGSVVHGVLAAAARGAAPGELELLGRALLVDYGRPLDSQGEPRELHELLALTERVLASDVWTRAQAAETRLSEVPFALAGHDTGGTATLLEGVVDLVFREPEGWVIADFKTDVGDDPGFPERSQGYRRQVELYAEAWQQLTDEPVKERLLVYATRGEVVTW